MSKRIYYVSQFDGAVHNINDSEHKLICETEAYIGQDCGEDGFKVNEEVKLWTITEVAEFFK
ncbi:hypothetical protein BRE01_62750 [Brevibacillus reuszeri]|uniref:Uncharacterized protein n=1 Tax=Brevibacillus reuszeri TaxID=54915 RepID=A0A0K9YWF9_9BACL|nr:hypothetical protein [Brevibacillus reuszeri]KNB72957.1 hypothetical protein ADS79_14135 [Brevibacillus reuszeri]GED72573.1 hypothetical protein BRE01_62750 [Brevibacillus reuszeri]